MNQQSNWPIEVPIVFQSTLDNAPQIYNKLGNQHSGSWAILRTIYPDTTSLAIDALVRIQSCLTFLSRSVGRATIINLTSCELGYTEGQEPSVLSLFNEIQQSKRYHAYKEIDALSRARANRPIRPMPKAGTAAAKVNQAKHARPYDGQVLHAARSTPPRPSLRRSQPLQTYRTEVAQKGF